jgi:integrase
MPQVHHKSAPSYRYHKSSKQAVVTLFDVETHRRRDVMLGEFDSKESRAKYAAVIAAWEKNGRRFDDPKQPAPKPDDLRVSEAVEEYLKEGQRKWRRPTGEPTGTFADIAITGVYLTDLFGAMPLADFGADQLEQLRDRLIADKRVCPQVNKRIGHARQWYTWCLARRKVPASVDAFRVLLEMKQRCRAISPGDFGAKAGKKVQPADPKAVEKALPEMPPLIQAVVQLLRLTGARPSELLEMKPRELDRTGETWLLRPEWHKTAKKGKARVIYLGPEAQAALAPWLLGTAADQLIFTAKRSEERRLKDLRERRTTPLWDSHIEAQERKRIENPKRRPGDRICPRVLANAVRRACRRAKVKPFSPYSLRHLRAVELRTKFGIETVRAVLGHSAASMSDHYSAAADGALANAAALQVG